MLMLKFFQIFHPIFSTAILPTIILLVINMKIHAKIPIRISSSRHRHMREFLLTKMGCIIVTVFILCNLPRLAVGIFELTR